MTGGPRGAGVDVEHRLRARLGSRCGSVARAVVRRPASGRRRPRRAATQRLPQPGSQHGPKTSARSLVPHDEWRPHEVDSRSFRAGSQLAGHHGRRRVVAEFLGGVRVTGDADAAAALMAPVLRCHQMHSEAHRRSSGLLPTTPNACATCSPPSVASGTSSPSCSARTTTSSCAGAGRHRPGTDGRRQPSGRPLVEGGLGRVPRAGRPDRRKYWVQLDRHGLLVQQQHRLIPAPTDIHPRRNPAKAAVVNAISTSRRHRHRRPGARTEATLVTVRLEAAALNRLDAMMLEHRADEPRARSAAPDGAGSSSTSATRSRRSPVSPVGTRGRDLTIPLFWGPARRPRRLVRDPPGPHPGTHAELVTVPAANVHPKPPHLDWAAAAALPSPVSPPGVRW